MKAGVSKTAPGDNPYSGLGSNKTARDDRRTDDRHDKKLDDIRTPVNTGLKAGMTQHCGGTGIASRNYD